MDKILLNLGLAKRAGQIVSGTDMVIEGLRNNSIYLVFLAKDTALNTTINTDSTYEKSFKGISQSGTQTYTYTSVAMGEHFIDVKYVKDGSQSSGNDSLQFKIEIQEVV